MFGRGMLVDMGGVGVVGQQRSEEWGWAKGDITESIERYDVIMSNTGQRAA